jgi:hypothetical protein
MVEEEGGGNGGDPHRRQEGVALGHGEKRREAGRGSVKPEGVLNFYRGQGGARPG